MNVPRSDLPPAVERTLAAIEAREPDVGALIDEPGRAGRMRREALALERRWPDATSRPPLYGLPVGVKDLFRVDGFPTRAGSALPPEAFAGPEAPVVSRLREAGVILAGKTTTDEFAYSEPPATRNPYDPTRTPGGSSAGSAAGVACGMFSLALGTQTSRSIIAPAAFCGVVGFKPSFGRVVIEGVVALAPSMDTVGVLASDTRLLRAAAPILVDDRRPAATPPFASSVRSPEVTGRLPVFGVPDGLYLDSLPREGWFEPFERSLTALRAAGASIVRHAVAWDGSLEEIYGSAMVLLHGEMARVHEEWWTLYGHLYRSRTRRGVERGRTFTVAEIGNARAAGLALREQVHGWLDERGVDFLVSPSQPEPAPLLGTTTGWGSTTTPWSFAGLPCLSIPSGTIGGLPVGLQVIGRYGADEELFAVTEFLETCLDATRSAEAGGAPPSRR